MLPDLPYSAEIESCADASGDYLFDGVKAVSKILNPTTNIEWIDGEMERLATEVKEIGSSVDSLIDVMLANGHGKVAFDATNQFRMSELDSVLRTGEGLPITIAMVAIELSRLLAIPAHGINVPGVFLMRINQTVVHPNGLDKVDLKLFVNELRKQNVFVPEDIEPASNRVTLHRIFKNLHDSALTMDEYVQAFEFCDYMKVLNPGSNRYYLDRARIWMAMGDTESVRFEIQQARDHANSDEEREYYEERLRFAPTSDDPDDPGLRN